VARPRRRAEGGAYFRPANNLWRPGARHHHQFLVWRRLFLAPAALVVGQRIVLDIHAPSTACRPLSSRPRSVGVAAGATAMKCNSAAPGPAAHLRRTTTVCPKATKVIGAVTMRCPLYAHRKDGALVPRTIPAKASFARRATSRHWGAPRVEP